MSQYVINKENFSKLTITDQIKVFLLVAYPKPKPITVLAKIIKKHPRNVATYITHSVKNGTIQRVGVGLYKYAKPYPHQNIESDINKFIDAEILCLKEDCHG